MIGALLWNLVLAAAGTAVVWLGSSRLEAASRRIAAHHGIPESVQGALLLAIASSFPELSSVVVATVVHGEFELGVAAIVGSAIFNILVIPSASVLAGGPLRVDRTLVHKDALFYLLAVAALLLTFALAAIYQPVAGGGIRGGLTRELVLIPLGLYAVYLFLQYHDTREQAAERGPEGGMRIAREWRALLGSMLAIAVGVELLVRSALNLGHALDTPTFLWGLTVVAAGTSVPDLFVSVRAARGGRGVASMSNVLGSNIFDLLVAVPAGVLLAGASVVDFARAAPMIGCLMLATLVLLVCLRREMTLRAREAAMLLALYAGFVAWVALESFGLLAVLNVG